MQTDLSTLNEQQRDAILKSVDHNIVLLAGAGSGKTFTLVKRTEYLITDLNVKPENIMMVTFTNKAANEIKERMMVLSDDAYKMWIGTFHKICTRLIRKFGSYLGINNFTIMDQKDAKEIISDILNSLGYYPDREALKAYQSKISEFKNNLMGKNDVMNDPTIDNEVKELYVRYVDLCWSRKTFDFDDLITYGILLLSSFEPVSTWVHDNIKYLMVDECQDTNSAQFVLIKLIAGDNNTLLVGDVNQSIYAFRNAKPAYLENYADTTPNTLKLKLEQNYRSTRTIIEAANNVVMNNQFGTKLHMFCDNEDGNQIRVYGGKTIYKEAEWVVNVISNAVTMFGKSYSDFAIIYRANYQSRVFEQELTRYGMPYTVFGSFSFYSRKEVRDLLAFCRVAENPFDIPSFTRVLKTIKGIGKKTIQKIINISTSNQIMLSMALKQYIDSLNKSETKRKLSMILDFMNEPYESCEDIVLNVFDKTEYRTSAAIVNTVEARESLGYMDEFRNMIHNFEENNSDSSISEILDELSLLSDAKGEDKANQDAVKLMTAHSSKGLEFNNVFVVEVHEGSFPQKNAIETGNPDDIEEERRLFYVAMTRAKKNLYITYPGAVLVDSFSVDTNPSRFIQEIPREYRKQAL